MISLSFFLVGFAVAAAARLPVECLQGEKYWCASVDNAKKCDTYDHCVSTVWASSSQLGADPKLCSDCKQLLGDVVQKIIGPDAEAQAQARTRNMCEQLPSQVTDYCETFSVDWVHNLFQFLNARADVGVVCSALSFCDDTVSVPSRIGFKLAKTVHAAFTDVSGNKTCNTCIQVINSFKTVVENEDFQSDLEGMVSSTLCTLMPPRVQAADADVLCQSMGFCSRMTFSARLHAAATMLRPVLANVAQQLQLYTAKFSNMKIGSSECGLCEMVVKEVTSSMKKGHSQDKLIKRMEKICEFLPDPLSSECQRFVAENGKTVIAMVLKTVSPRMICEAIGMCDPKHSFSKQAPILLNVLATKADESKPEPAASTEVVSKPADHEVNRGGYVTPWCKICQNIAEVADNFIGSQELEEIFVGVGRGFCELFKGNMKRQCKSYAGQAVGGMLGQMTEIMVPPFVCGVIGVCEVHLTPMHYNVKPIFDPYARVYSQEH